MDLVVGPHGAAPSQCAHHNARNSNKNFLHNIKDLELTNHHWHSVPFNHNGSNHHFFDPVQVVIVPLHLIPGALILFDSVLMVVEVIILGQRPH